MVRLHAPVLKRLPLHRDHDRCSEAHQGPQCRERIHLCPSPPPCQAGRLHGIGKPIIRIQFGILREIPQPGTETRSCKEVEGNLLTRQGIPFLVAMDLFRTLCESFPSPAGRGAFLVGEKRKALGILLSLAVELFSGSSQMAIAGIITTQAPADGESWILNPRSKLQAEGAQPIGTQARDERPRQSTPRRPAGHAPRGAPAETGTGFPKEGGIPAHPEEAKPMAESQSDWRSRLESPTRAHAELGLMPQLSSRHQTPWF